MLTLVLGCARSGKSRFAQSLCAGAERVVYIATARAEDEEMRQRIERHRQSRPETWCTVEQPLEIASVIESLAGDCDFILIDCLTLWLSNLCWELRGRSEDSLERAVSQQTARLVDAASRTKLIAVSNEVGGGLVPDSAVGRIFRDLHGWMNQDLARAADSVYQLVAGIPIAIKQPSVTS